MQYIKRYTVDPATGKFDAPKEAIVLSVGQAGPNLVLFAIVQDNAAIVEQQVAVFTNGQPVPETTRPFIGTVQLNGTAYHVFQGPLTQG